MTTRGAWPLVTQFSYNREHLLCGRKSLTALAFGRESWRRYVTCSRNSWRSHGSPCDLICLAQLAVQRLVAFIENKMKKQIGSDIGEKKRN